MKANPKFSVVLFGVLALALCLTVRAQTGPGYAAAFDGNSNYFTVPALVGLAPGNTPHTIEAWINVARLPPPGAREWLLKLGVPGSAHHWLCQPDGTCVIGMWGGVQVRPALPLGIWTHVAATFDGTTLQVFTNGLLAAANTGPFNLQGVPLGLAQAVAAGLGTNEQFFNGQLDEVRIWAANRTQAQLQAGLHRALTGSETGLVAYWRFSSTDSQTHTSADSTSNGNNGSLLSGASTVLSGAPFAPDVLTGTATVQTGNNALLAGSVNPGNLATTASFQWGLDTNYGTTTTFTNLSGTNAAIAMASQIIGLSPLATYHFRVAATNSGGVTLGGDQTFVVPGGAPVVVTTAANPVSFNSATLKGTVDPNATATAAWFEWSPNTTFSNRTAATNFGVVAGAQAVAAALSSLSPGTNYHFRLVASNALYGRVQGVEQNFTPIFARSGLGLPGVYNGSVAWVDYDNDGRMDMLITGLTNVAALRRVTQLWRNTGASFTSVQPGMPGVYNSAAAWGDFDNDGLADLLLIGATNNTANAVLAQLWHNTSSGFTNSPIPGLPGVASGSVAWGDYDNDGRLDFLITGMSSNGPVSQVWHNTGSGFTNITIAGLPGVFNSAAGWGDYDNDGRLDFLIAGDTGSNVIAQIWRNTGAGFTNSGISLPGVRYGAVAWGDYDNDGRLDFILTGADSNSNLLAQLWHNTGSGFTNVPVPGLPGVASGSVAWGDYDNDGLIDILLTGSPDNGVTSICQVWRNTGTGFTDIHAGLPGTFGGGAVWGESNGDGTLDVLLAGAGQGQLWRSHQPKTNTVPTAPSGLVATGTPSTVTLTWTTATDGQTPTNGLTYNLRIGTAPSGGQICNPSADSSTGLRRLAQPGNVGQRLAFTLSTNLPPGFFYWSVQAVDGGLAGGRFAPESVFASGGDARITNMTLLPNNHMLLDILGTPGRSYRGLATPNCGLPSSNWTVIGSATEIAPGHFQVTDPAVAGQSNRFYEVVTP